jgi:predicted Zn-dependent peptidase
MKHKFYRKKLRNGMTVIFEQRKGSGVVSVAFGVRYGAINEDAEEKGISHFTEHMLFKGTKKRTAKQISEEIEKRGGILNGFTEEEFIFCTSKISSSKIDIALDVLSDMIKNPSFDERELEKERKVIFEEIKLYNDNPRMWIQDNIASCLFRGSPGMTVAGTEETLSKIDRKKIIVNFRKVYGTTNMFLCVVGDADFKKLYNYCERNFVKSKAELKEQSVEKILKEKIEKRRGIDQANLALIFHTAKAFEKDNYASQVLMCLMGGGMSSRLWQEIRERRNLAYSVHANCSFGKRYGYNKISVGCSPENVEKIKEIILKEFERVAKALDKKELNQVKEQIIGNNRISKEDSEGQMLDLICNETWGNAKKSYEYEKEIAKVKLKDVKKIASQVKEGNYSFLALVPE